MRHNKAFWRSIHSLSHPATICAVILLLLNDHLLRIHAPSWWTGKLGDAAWLIFAPFILAALVSWIIPRTSPNQERIVGLSSITFIGVWFAAAKTIPVVHSLTVNVLDSIVGWHGTLRVDPEDLITLPCLLISWYIWQQARNSPYMMSPVVWVVGALAIMGTLATSCAEREQISVHGIANLCTTDNAIFTQTTLQDGFKSTDGGLTWQSVIQEDMEDCYRTDLQNILYPTSNEFQLTANDNNYRVVRTEGVYSSKENEPEQLEIDLTHLSRDVRTHYYEQPVAVCGTPLSYLPGPLDAVVDTHTGNIVLAMSLDGVLVRTTDGSWNWVTVGDYSYAKIGLNDMMRLRGLFIYNAILLLFLLPPTLIIFAQRQSIFAILGLILGWFIWLANFIVFGWFSYEMHGTIGKPFWVCLFIGILLNLNILARGFFSRLSPIIMVMILSIFTMSLCTLPHILWIGGTVPDSSTAYTFGMMLGFAALVSSVQMLYWRYGRHLESEKNPPRSKPLE